MAVRHPLACAVPGGNGRHALPKGQLVIIESTVSARWLSARASIAVIGVIVVAFTFVAVLTFRGEQLPGSCVEALADVNASADFYDAEAQRLISDFLSEHPPGSESAARDLIAVYDAHDEVMRRAIGVCPGGTVTAIRANLDRTADARRDMMRTCAVEQWSC